MKYPIIIIFGLLLFCCKSKLNENTEDVAHLDFEKHVSKMDISDLIDKNNVSYARLETNDNCLIGHITRLLISNNRIYILDRKMAKALLVFSLDGKHLFNINKIGEGPGEFRLPVDFAIISEKNEIVLWDHNRKLIFYDSEGNFKNEINFDLVGTSFIVKDDYFYFYTNQMRNSDTKNFSIYIYDHKLSLKSRLLEFTLKYNVHHSLEGKEFYLSDNSVHFISKFSDKVLRFDGLDYSTKYKLDLGESKMPDEYITDWETYHKKHKDYTFIFERVIETDSVLYLSIHDKGVPKHAFYFKTEEEFIIIDKMLNESNLVYAEPEISYGNRFVGVINPHILLEDLKFDTNGSLNEKFSDLNEHDNPVLFFYSVDPSRRN